MRVDLNADVGESFGAYTIGCDAALLQSITSASVAAGFHAGDPSILRATIRLAAAAGVAVGAHPGLPDRAGFGRRVLSITPRDAEDAVLYQIAAVGGVAAAEGVRLRHVKLHGALYHMAAVDQALADAVTRAVVAFDPGLVVFLPEGSALDLAARRAGLRTAAEAFADRAYRTDGSLVPRNEPGAIIADPAIAVPRAVRLVREGVVVADEGREIRIAADTICVHGDTPGADVLAAAVRAGLAAAGVEVGPVPRAA